MALSPRTPESPLVSVIVPVYFNAGSLPSLFEEFLTLETSLSAQGARMQLIFVDDGSGDNSLSLLRDFKARRPDTIVVKLTRNFGSVHASKTGFRFVEGDCFVILPADLQDPPSLLLTMLDRWKAGSKYVVAARANRGDPAITQIFSRVYYRLLKLLVVKDYPAGGYDVALWDKAFLPYMLNSSKNINTPLFAFWLGFTPDVVHYERQPRLHGKSRWTFSKRIKFLLDSLLGFSILPIRAISAIGLIVSTVSFIYGGLVVIQALRGRVPVAGFATLASLMAFLMGLVIVMLGIIGEYIWRIFDEVNKRPETVIDEVL